MNKMTQSIDLLNEFEMLSSIPRSGFAFLGSGRQTVAEHSYQTAIVAYVLARLLPEPIDIPKLILMCLFHDLPEARIGDLNYVQKKYVHSRIDKALEDIEKASFLGPEIITLIKEYEEGVSPEAQLAHDADQLELFIILKQEEERGNKKAAEWMANLTKRLQTDLGKKVAEAIRTTPSDGWWLQDKTDSHWIDGGKKKSRSPIESDNRPVA